MDGWSRIRSCTCVERKVETKDDETGEIEMVMEEREEERINGICRVVVTTTGCFRISFRLSR